LKLLRLQTPGFSLGARRSPRLASRFLLLALCSVLFAPLARGQATLSKTTLGQSQNSQADLANSLVPGKPKFGKGEKTEQVDAKKLPTKSVKDPAFQGTLMDLDLDWTGDKMGKPHSAADTDSKTPKQAEPATEKNSKVARQADAAAGKESSSKSTDSAGDAQNKKEKTASSASDGKQSEKEKTSGSRPEGDH